MEERLPKISITKEGETKTYEAQHLIMLFEHDPKGTKITIDIDADFEHQVKTFRELANSIAGNIKKAEMPPHSKGLALSILVGALGAAMEQVADDNAEILADYFAGEMITDVRGSSVQRGRGSSKKGTPGKGNGLRLV